MKVKVKTEKEMELISYYVLRGVKVNCSGVKLVIAEKKLDRLLTEDEIATFIVENGCDFASVAINYRVCEPDDWPSFQGRW